MEGAKRSGVPKVVGQRNPSHALRKTETVAYEVDDGCNNRQTNALHIPAHTGNAKSNATCEPIAPSNGATRHCRLPQNKYLPYRQKSHTFRSDTKATDKHQIHRCNTTWPCGPRQPCVGALVVCVPRPPTSPKCSEFGGRPASQGRFRFFLADKREQLIHFCHLHFGWHRCGRQAFGMLSDPECDRLRIDLQMTGNPTEIASIHIHLNGPLAEIDRIPLWLGFRCVLPLAVHTTVAL
jgi:hypothetical protein